MPVAASAATPGPGSAAGRCASGPRSRVGGWSSTRRRVRARRSRPCCRWGWSAVPEGEAAPAGIRVAIVDDHPVFRLGMAGLLGSLDGITVVAQAADAAGALAIEPGSVDVVLMDLHLGEDSGIETTRELVRRDPGVRVLVVTMREDDESVVACMRVGARGYLLKGASPDEVERAVRAVANGEAILGPAVAARAVAALTAGRTSARVPFPE